MLLSVCLLVVFLLQRRLDAAPPSGPTIALPQPDLVFTGSVYSVIADQTMMVSNSGNATLHYTLSSDVFWLGVSNPEGDLDAGMATSHVVSVATRGLDPLRLYSGHVVVQDATASNSPQALPVSLVLGSLVLPSKVVGWGENNYGELDIPANLTNAVAISGGAYHSLALLPNGTVVAWGRNDNGQASVPSILSTVVAVSGGKDHSLALLANGTVSAWGQNDYGQTDVPDGLTNVVAVSAGGDHSLALLGDGSVVAWGRNENGQTDVPFTVTSAVAISAGERHSLALLSNGTIEAWGSNISGQTTLPPGLSNVVAVAAGGYHSLALSEDGVVVAWGDSLWGQTLVPPSLSNAVSIAAGSWHSLAMRMDGTVSAWGGGFYGGSTVPSNLTNVVVISDAGYHTLALTPAQSLLVSSFSNSSTPGLGSYWLTRGCEQSLESLPTFTTGGTQWLNNGWVGTGDVPPTGTSNSVTILLTQNSSITWDWQPTAYWLDTACSDGGVVDTADMWVADGSNVTITDTNVGVHAFLGWFGETNNCSVNGTAIVVPMTQARHVEAIFENPAMQVSPSFMDFTGRLYSAVSPGMLTVSNAGTVPLSYTLASDVFWLGISNPAGTLAAGMSTSHIVTAYSRGLGARQTYSGTISIMDPLETVPPQSLPVTLTLSTSNSGGRIAGWGNNLSGQTGVPAGFYDAVDVSAGGSHALAIGSDGRVVAWGYNGYHQADVPAGLTNVLAVSAGSYHSLALKADGSAVGWGYGWGQTNLLSGLTNLIALSAGADHSLALCSDGSVMSWGINTHGQTNVPSSLTNGLAVAAGSEFSVALRSDGTVVAWGLNDYGQTTVPAGLTNVVAVSAGYYHSVALRSDGTVVAWGDNSFGETNVPIGLTNVVAVSAGGYHSLALCSDGTIASWGYNVQGQTVVPAGLSNVMAMAGGGYFSLAIAPARSLVVQTEWGNPSPSVGTNWLAAGLVQICSVTSEIVMGNTQYVNRGWMGSGAVPAFGTSNKVAVAMYQDSSIAWNWQTNYWLSLAATNGGIVSNQGWYIAGSNVMAHAIFTPGYDFTEWAGDTDGCTIVGTQITIPMTRPRSLEARCEIHGILSATPLAVLFTGQVFSTVAPQTVMVSNTGPGPLTYTLSSDRFWLSVENPAGQLGVGMATSHVITVSTRGLEGIRQYSGRLTFVDPNASNTPLTVLVSLGLVPLQLPSKVIGWGGVDAGPTNVPIGLTNAVLAGGGYFHSVALKANGTLAFWGNNDSGQTNQPFSVTGVTAFACGWGHTLALLGNGRVIAWGRNTEGETNVPPDLTNAVAVSAGVFHSMAVRQNGTVTAWGDNSADQTTVPGGLTNAVAVAGGVYHSVVLKADGSVVAWGWNHTGETNVPSTLTNAVAIAAGAYHSVALNANGTVVAWGDNGEGQTSVPADLSNVLAVAAGAYFSEALCADGTVVAWGRNVSAETNVPAGLKNVAGLGAGGYHSLALAPARSLVVSSVAGTANPVVGTNWTFLGDIQQVRVDPVVTNGGTQYVNTGWVGSGNLPATGTSNSLSYVVTSNSTITWNWMTNYWLGTATSGNGTFMPSAGWYAAGSNLSLIATPSAYWHFDSWGGGITGVSTGINPLSVTLGAPLQAMVTFAVNTTSNGIPEEWFAGHGWTNNFEVASTNDVDGDGLLTWEEYVADVDPTNAGSVFMVNSVAKSPVWSVTFHSSTGRLYSLEISPGILVPLWSGLYGQTNIPGNGLNLTLTNTNPPAYHHYYRVRVALP